MPSQVNKYQTILVIVLGFLGLYKLAEYRGWGFDVQFMYIAIGLGVGGLLPYLGDWIVKGWFGLAIVLGWIMSRFWLSVIFFLLLFPIASLYKVFNRNSLQRKRTEGGSVFTERNHKYTPKDLENVW